jgi:hypothetical protein
LHDRELLTAAAKRLENQNNPLMVRHRHWKSFSVLPTFQLSLIGAPDHPGGTPNVVRLTRVEMPLWMKS